jgi:hypothetical protein
LSSEKKPAATTGGGGAAPAAKKDETERITCALAASCDGEDFPADEDTGIKCTNGHTLCAACSAGAVAAMLSAEGRDSIFVGGKDVLKCMVCRAAPLVVETFERQLNEEQMAHYHTWLLIKAPEPGFAPVACPKCPYFAMHPTDAHPALVFCQNEARSVARKSAARPHVVWLSNLPHAATADDVRAFATAPGRTITNVDVGVPGPRPSGSAQPASASAWIAYASAKEADAAVAKLNGRTHGGRIVAAALSGTKPNEPKHVMCLAGSCGYCKGTFEVEGATVARGQGWQGEGAHGAARHFECAALGPFKTMLDDACFEGAQVTCPYPGCGHKARKDGNCTHIVCTKCQQSFCYGCGLAVANCDGSRDGIFHHHNVGWETNPKRCPWYLHNIATEGRTAYHRTWPKDGDGAVDKLQHMLSLRTLKATIPRLGAKARAEAALANPHPAVVKAVAGGASDTVAGWRMYDTVVARWPGATGGFTKEEINAFDPAAPLFAR